MKVETSSIVRRPAEAAFDFLVNLENEPRWNPWAIKAVKLSEGPVHEGTVFRATYKRFGEMDVKITGYERPKRFVITTDTKQMSGRHELMFEPAEGGTKVTQRGDMRPKGLMKVMALFMGPMLRGHFRELSRGVQTALQA